MGTWGRVVAGERDILVAAAAVLDLLAGDITVGELDGTAKEAEFWRGAAAGMRTAGQLL